MLQNVSFRGCYSHVSPNQEWKCAQLRLQRARRYEDEAYRRTFHREERITLHEYMLGGRVIFYPDKCERPCIATQPHVEFNLGGNIFARGWANLSAMFC